MAMRDLLVVATLVVVVALLLVCLASIPMKAAQMVKHTGHQDIHPPVETEIEIETVAKGKGIVLGLRWIGIGGDSNSLEGIEISIVRDRVSRGMRKGKGKE